MTLRLAGLVFAAFILAAPLAAAPQEAPAPTPMAERRNAVAIFAGIYSCDIVTSPWDTQTEDIDLLSIAYSRRLATVLRHLDIEVKAGAGRRFGDNDSLEAHAAPARR